MRKIFFMLKCRVDRLIICVCKTLKTSSGEGFVDTAIKVLMAVVIGALLLAGLYSLFGDVVLPTLTQKIKELFNYAG